MLSRGAITSTQLTRSLLDRIEAREGQIQAWVYLNAEHALAQAQACDRAPRKSPLHGVSVGFKDVTHTADMPTQHNSPIYKNHQPAEDAECVGILRALGAVIFGKTQTLEFACGGNSPPTQNPWDLARTPGGSSSGSAAAVADGMVPLTLGTQTGGSTIRPAAFCGVYAMKPTYGRASLEGVKHFSPHLDTLGFFSRSVDDLILLADAFNLTDRPALPSTNIQGLRIAVCETPMWPQADADAQSALHEAAGLLAQAGAAVKRLVLSAPFDALTAQHDTLMQDGGRGAFLAEYLAQPALLHDDFKRKVNNQFGITAQQMREVLDAAALRRIDFEREMGDADAVLTLSAPGVAPLGLETQGMATFNRIWTALHVPAISLPGMRAPNGLPIGLQLVQRRYEDAKLLQVASAVAQVLDPQGRTLWN